MKYRRSRFLLFCLIFGYSFLYLPILTLIMYSFTKASSPLRWSEFSLIWYKNLFSNQVVLAALKLSLKIAFLSATMAVLIGMIGAIVMVRFRSFKGRGFFNAIVTAPLVMPDVMMGLSLLLFFAALQQWLGWPASRGLGTIIIGHTTIAIAYVLIIIRNRLYEFDPQLEQAAMDLGARPFKAFLQITLPFLYPSIGAGWLLAFTISFDDVILASFLSGPGSTTLPMYLFSSIRFNMTPEINALASLIIFLVAIGVMIAGIFMLYLSPKAIKASKAI